MFTKFVFLGQLSQALSIYLLVVFARAFRVRGYSESLTQVHSLPYNLYYALRKKVQMLLLEWYPLKRYTLRIHVTS